MIVSSFSDPITLVCPPMVGKTNKQRPTMPREHVSARVTFSCV